MNEDANIRCHLCKKTNHLFPQPWLDVEMIQFELMINEAIDISLSSSN